MTFDYISDIIKELEDAPLVFREAIQRYRKMDEDDPRKKELHDALARAKGAFIDLDVYLQDLQLTQNLKKLNDLENKNECK